jgi:hypothetical protein
MITPLFNDVKSIIISDVHSIFNTIIEDDIIDFIQDFQSRIAVEEGFAKNETVRFYNLAVFQYNPKKIDSKTTMVRLLHKYNGDKQKAFAEFKQLGKDININNKLKKKYNREHKVVKLLNHAPVKSVCGKFSAR